MLLNRLYRDTQFILNFFGVNEGGENRNIANQRFILEAQEFLTEWIDETLREQFMVNIAAEERHEIVLGLAELAMNHTVVMQVVNAITDYVNEREEFNITEVYEDWPSDEFPEGMMGVNLLIS